MSDKSLERIVGSIRDFLSGKQNSLPTRSEREATEIDSHPDAGKLTGSGRFFAYRPEYSDREMWGDYVGAAPGSLRYKVSRPTGGVQFVPSGVSSMTYAHGWVGLHLQGAAIPYRESIHDAITPYETDNITLMDAERNGFPGVLAEFNVELDDRKTAAQVHDRAALMIHHGYRAFLESVVGDLEGVEWHDDVLSKPLFVETEEGGYESNVTHEEADYRHAVAAYSQEFPNIVEGAERHALSLSNRLHKNLIRLEGE